MPWTFKDIVEIHISLLLAFCDCKYTEFFYHFQKISAFIVLIFKLSCCQADYLIPICVIVCNLLPDLYTYFCFDSGLC